VFREGSYQGKSEEACFIEYGLVDVSKKFRGYYKGLDLRQ
jgi:hypothetical protein